MITLTLTQDMFDILNNQQGVSFYEGVILVIDGIEYKAKDIATNTHPEVILVKIPPQQVYYKTKD